MGESRDSGDKKQAAKAGRTARTTALQAQVETVCVPVMRAAGIELIELRVLRSPRNSYRVQLFVDRPLSQVGVTIDDCADVSRKVGAVLELDDPFPGGWDLEVSSPGMKRRLRGTADMLHFAGTRARIAVRDLSGAKKTFIGTLEGADEQKVTLRLEGGALHEVARADIERAELDPTMEQWLELGKARAQRAAGESQVDAVEAAMEGVVR